MIELAMFIVIVVALIATRKLIRKWLDQQLESAEVWVEDTRNERQHEIKRVYDERDNLIKSHGKWYSVDDVQDLTHKKNVQ